MNKNKQYHGYTKANFLIACARNIIFQVPYEQDYLLLNYQQEITQALMAFLKSTTKENLEMIYQDKFKFKMKFDEINSLFNIRVEYIH